MTTTAADGGTGVMSGQGCTNATRILLPRRRLAEGLAVLKATIERFPYGDPWDMGNYSGPSISDVQRAKVLGMISGAVASGATLLAGGGKPAHLPTGYYIEPTLLSDVDPRSVIGQEETFGPVVTVTPYDTEDEAVAIANDTVYGLAGAMTVRGPDPLLAYIGMGAGGPDYSLLATDKVRFVATQSVHLTRAGIAACLGMEPEQVQVLAGDIGGSFGLKISASREELAVAAAARALGRPVKWVEDRSEHLATVPLDADVNFRGVGEGGMIVAPPTLVSAIEDALAPFGVRIYEQHLLPARILELIAAQG